MKRITLVFMNKPLEPFGDTPDEALLIAYGNGDAEAARLLTQRLVPRLLKYAMRLLGGDRAEAEDVAQEAMLRLWKVAPDWRQGEAKVSSWLYRVATNLCTDRHRKARHSGEMPEVEPADPSLSAVAQMTQAARLAALDAALAKLPERQRQAVVLRHIEGLTNPEIAAAMDIGVEAVESLTARGKRTITAILAGKKKELGYADEQD
jgi:RNA polymerase sigma factor (sigma-70 family)